MATFKKTISERKFQALVRKFRSLRQSAASASVDSKLETFWTYGDLIVDEKLLDDAGYHNSVLRDLAVESGVSLRTLQQSVAFRRGYRAPPTGLGLTWAHVRVLVQLPHKKQRDFYAKLAQQEGWTSRELQKAVGSDLYSGGQLAEPTLDRPTKASFLYRIKEVRVIDGDTVEALIDLGFHSFALQRIRLAQLNAPELRTAAGRAARNFLAEQLAGQKTIIVKTLKSDLHGRYVGHVFSSPRKLSVDDCFDKGTHINDALVRHNHARVVG